MAKNHGERQLGSALATVGYTSTLNNIGKEQDGIAYQITHLQGKTDVVLSAFLSTLLGIELTCESKGKLSRKKNRMDVFCPRSLSPEEKQLVKKHLAESGVHLVRFR